MKIYFSYILCREINKEKKQEKKKWKAEMRKAGVEIQKVKTTKMAQSTCKQRVVLDMSYDELMSNKVGNRYYYILNIDLNYNN